VGDDSGIKDIEKILAVRDEQLLRKFVQILDERDNRAASLQRLPSSEKIDITSDLAV